MKQSLANEVMYLKGVGPQRAALLAEREIRTIQDLLGYLPFRYENRLRFASIRELAPGGTYTVQAEVVSGGLVSFARSRNAVYHLMVRDATGVLHCKFFHSGYLEGRFKARKRIVLHGKVDIDPYRPGRLEMINPQYEFVGDESADSTEVGRIVPIYEAIGSLGSRTLRRVIYSALVNLDAAIPDPLPGALLTRYGFPSRRDALTYVHFPPPTEDVETLNAFRSPAHQRLIFEEFFFYQLSLALRRQQGRQQTGIAFTVREPRIREALKRILPFKPTAKKAARERVRAGAAQLVVGTHALIEEDVEFARLGLVVVDEQHRFGVLQRLSLIEKGVKKGASPHVLVMTATPIPRTLSLTLYGDLESSVIDELPPGRAPIVTRWTVEAHLPRVWDFLRREAQRGRQGYIVYPVIEESKQELKAALVEYERLSKTVFPGLKLGLLHGRMRSEEKEEVMERFRRGEIQALGSTTVIEVGVDVPNATVMVIEHAERFGLAQLHQLRGRIGRGPEKSYCILVAPKKVDSEADDPARVRLETMVRTTNGFEIAEIDLKLRGPGEFFVTRQHGQLGFHIANPLRDRELLELARREAFALVENPEAEPERRRIFDYLGPKWQRRYQLAAVG